jgi:AcrR family transcriptional regulator
MGKQRGKRPVRGGAGRGDAARSYHHGTLKKALVDGGLALLAREGLAGFSLRSLAKELGVSHAAPYRHFRSRDQLLVAIVTESRERFAEALTRSVADPGIARASARERMYVLGETFVRFYLEHPEIHFLFNVLPGQLAAQGERFRELLSPKAAGREDATFVLLRATVAGALGEYPGLSERDILLGCWAKVYGLASILVAQPDYFAPEDVTDGIRRVIRQAF